MKKFQLKRIGESEAIGNFNSKVDAAEHMEEIIDDNNDDLDSDDEDYLTPFDFECTEIEVSEVNEELADYEAAKKFIGLVPDIKTSISAINPKHLKALIALNTLFTIAEAWNKADGFIPDYDNGNQNKWFPWFKKTPAGFVFATTDYAATYTYASLGSRLCFKTSERARQFGEQFIELWNDVLLFR